MTHIVWIVMDHTGYESQEIVAVYQTKALAESHVAAMDGWIEEFNVLNVLHPDVTDPEKLQKREIEAARNRQERAARKASDEARNRLVQEQRPNPPHMRLCACETFTSKEVGSLIPWTAHGYCAYCGGWAPRVFRQHMGENSIRSAIEYLAVHDRAKMRDITSKTTTES